MVQGEPEDQGGGQVCRQVHRPRQRRVRDPAGDFGKLSVVSFLIPITDLPLALFFSGVRSPHFERSFQAVHSLK